MPTLSELSLQFMLALASSSATVNWDPDTVFVTAKELALEYINNA